MKVYGLFFSFSLFLLFLRGGKDGHNGRGRGGDFDWPFCTYEGVPHVEMQGS
jgi:hypothetical protein